MHLRKPALGTTGKVEHEDVQSLCGESRLLLFGIGLEGGSVMAKRSERTTRSQIRQALRRLSLRSRERAACLRRDKYTCQRCGKKQSRAKGKEVYVEAHHTKGVLWDVLIDQVYEMLLCHPDDMITLCKACHKKEGACKIAEESGL